MMATMRVLLLLLLLLNRHDQVLGQHPLFPGHLIDPVLHQRPQLRLGQEEHDVDQEDVDPLPPVTRRWRHGSGSSFCVPSDRPCLFSSGLLASFVKLDCCAGSTCTLIDSDFVCVDDRKLRWWMRGRTAERVRLSNAELATLGLLKK